MIGDSRLYWLQTLSFLLQWLGFSLDDTNAGTAKKYCQPAFYWPEFQLQSAVWVVYWLVHATVHLQIKPSRINSFFRCEGANQAVGGAPASLHMFGTGPTRRPFGAIDVQLSAADVDRVARGARAAIDFFRERTGWPYGCGVIVYSWGAHFDLRAEADYVQDER